MLEQHHVPLGEVASLGHLPLVVLLEDERHVVAEGLGVVWDDAHESGTTLDLRIDSLEGVGGPDGTA